ncbi:hypothetical protein ACJJTC_009740 [Scirpophaga incertulas]
MAADRRILRRTACTPRRDEVSPPTMLPTPHDRSTNHDARCEFCAFCPANDKPCSVSFKLPFKLIGCIMSWHEESEESAVYFNFDSENISEDCVVYQISKCTW